MSGAGVCSEVVGPWLGLAGMPFASVRLRPWGGGRGRWRQPLLLGDVCSADPRRIGTQIARSPQLRPADMSPGFSCEKPRQKQLCLLHKDAVRMENSLA